MAIGEGRDPTFAHFVAGCAALGAPCLALDPGAVEDWSITLDPAGTSYVVVGGAHVALDPDVPVYQRLVDRSPVRSPDAAPALSAALAAWLEVVPARVINRPGHERHCAAGPLHAHRLRELGFAVPPTRVTSRRAELHAFLAEHGPCVARPLCGARGAARRVTAAELADFSPDAGPVQLQRHVAGTGVRAHVVGGRIHAEHVAADPAERAHRAFELPLALRVHLIAATRALGLAFAAWDFALDAAGTFWCLEADPMPGYAGPDRRADGAITRSLLAFLDAQGDAC